MQAVILAAGKSNRFYPFNSLPHKSFVNIMGKKLIEHTILELEKAGILEIIVVIKNKEHKLNINSKVKITYAYQGEALGMADALLKAKHFLKDDFFLLNAYHVNSSKFINEMVKNKKNKDDVVLLLRKENKNLTKYGVPIFKNNKIVKIIEKPKYNKNDLRVVGIYLLPLKILNVLENLPAEHYLLEKAISNYASENNVTYFQTDEETISLKYPWDLLELSKNLFKNSKLNISKKAIIAKNAVIEGNVTIEEGVRVLEGACVKGPCFIGKNTIIGNSALIRENSIIGENCVIGAFSEIKNSIILENSKIHSGFIGDSVIGQNCRIGAGFMTANRRFDRKNIKIDSEETYFDSLGVMMGNNVKVGVNVSTMPGVVIGQNSIIGPATLVDKNIKEDTLFYAKYSNFVEKKIKND